MGMDLKAGHGQPVYAPLSGIHRHPLASLFER
jgi:murein DD-endopeptidase MepM/ murein hydrolase activator NlpD